jgi:hypothetical protein
MQRFATAVATAVATISNGHCNGRFSLVEIPVYNKKTGERPLTKFKISLRSYWGLNYKRCGF